MDSPAVSLGTKKYFNSTLSNYKNIHKPKILESSSIHQKVSLVSDTSVGAEPIMQRVYTLDTPTNPNAPSKRLVLRFMRDWAVSDGFADLASLKVAGNYINDVGGAKEVKKTEARRFFGEDTFFTKKENISGVVPEAWDAEVSFDILAQSSSTSP